MTRAPRPSVQRRTLVRARGLAAFRSVLVDQALDGGPIACRRRTLVLPTRASAELLRQSIESEAARRGRTSVIFPDLVTRDDWISGLHRALPGAPPLLARTAREVLLGRAARETAGRARMPDGPFHLRPGLLAEMLRFYDTLRLRQRTVRRFARALFDDLRVERGTDRGSEGLIHQTCFLGFAFLAYERGLAASGALDEHALRRRLIAEQPALAFDHVVVAVADRSSDLRGLWPADFDLIGRLHGIAAVDVVMTDETHDAGFRERLEGELPGIEERLVAAPDAATPAGPILIRPPRDVAEEPRPTVCFMSRDREEELRDVVRVIRRRAADAGGVLTPTAIVFQRPLPYLYLAEPVLADAQVPFQIFDTLPLASEPYAALLDLVLAMARTAGTREATVALLRSTLVRFDVDGAPVGPRDAAALDAVLTARRTSGDASTYAGEVAAWFGDRPARDGFDAAGAGRAARAAATIHAELAPYRAGTSASARVATIADFLRRHQRQVPDGDPSRERSRRARAAVLGVLDALADALLRYDDAPRPHDAVTAVIHHVIEAQTFAPARRAGSSGVHLVDAVAARFGEFAHVHLVGLVETDWPERAPGSILYTTGLLKPLGWPQSGEHAQGEQAAFRDLLGLAAETLRLHAFQLDGDSVVALSPILEAARRLPSREEAPAARRRIFADELLTAVPMVAPAAGAGMGDWLAARVERPPLSTPAYSGAVDAQPPQSYRVSRVDRYAECPFKYFAESVLGLPEEREEMSGLTPLERGNLIHGLLERFYRAWQAEGRGAITAATLPEALARFTALTHAALAGLPEADRALEETRLLGSIVARGIAERVFEAEADEGGQIVERLIEHELRGAFAFPLLGGMAQKTIEIRGKADRIDVFDDGSIRVIDYKLSRLPDLKTSTQIAVYAYCAAQVLEARNGRPHAVDSAVYLAFGEEGKSRGGFEGRTEPADQAVHARAGAFAAAVQRIEQGEFPARPLRADQCRWCRYAGVCRKEYRLEARGEDDAAEPVDLPPDDARVADPPPPDQAARDFAIDPGHHVVLEASAGTGKTRVLVDRYVRLIEQGVDPRHVLAMTFTRKAAAEMRDRVLAELDRRAGESPAFARRWAELADRVTDVQVSTIDAFCFGLLREFPLEADVDPAFEIADETEMARFSNEALDLTWRRVRGIIAADENVRLLLARVRLPQLRDALAACLDRRHVAQPAVSAFIERHVRVHSPGEAGAAFVSRVRDAFHHSPHRRAILDDGPAGAPEFGWLRTDLAALGEFPVSDATRVRQLEHRLTRYFLTESGSPRAGVAAKRFGKADFPSADAKKRHDAAIKALAPDIHDAIERLASDVNGLLARGLERVLAIAVDAYERLLEEHALLDFAGMLARSVGLLARQEEFARSRLKLQARYHHLLIDEFQDTSRLQWRLIELLIDAWGEGEGATDAPTSIFVVGDRKQSIYRFRHAEVTLLDEAARKIAALRPGFDARRAISSSFRAVPELLAFVNALAGSMPGDPALPERFRYEDSDRFPAPVVQPGARRDSEPVLGLVAEATVEQSASAVAAEIVRLLRTAVVRDRQGPPRPAGPSDIAILFRARAGHQYFEEALDAHGVRSYVYKGLGFFDAPEVQDLQALLRFLAQPDSDLRAAEFLRSRFVRLSDVALARLAPDFAATLDTGSGVARRPRATPDPRDPALDPVDTALLERARADVPRWLALADRVAPSQLIDIVIRESAYTFEMRGGRLDQARENVKKVRALVRRVENRGYATLGRLAEYFETLKSGEESNAIVAARGCVNLMTIHAAKGLEFPIVFIVNMHAGGAGGSAVTVIERGPGDEPHVAFGSTEGTRLEDRREREELRRLLYVAVTRARDRLYFAGTVDRNGRLMRAGRSLASLLPATLSDCFAAAAAQADEVVWPGLSAVEGAADGGGFAFRVCRPAETPAPFAAPPDVADAEPDTAPLTDSRPVVTTASSEPAAQPLVAPASGPPAADGPDRHARLVGTVVHRLLARALDRTLDAATIMAMVPHLVRWEELVDVADVNDVARRAAELFMAVRRRADVEALVSEGDCLFEVPFSCRPSGRPGELVRGAIDCLILSRDGRATILEFKTGRARPEHDAQAAAYAEAVQAALGGRPVDVKIIYPQAK